MINAFNFIHLRSDKSMARKGKREAKDIKTKLKEEDEMEKIINHLK